MNKKLFVFAIFIFLFYAQPSEAKFCIACGQELPDNAAFCSRCRAPQSQSSDLNQAPVQYTDYKGYILALFKFIDDLEISFQDVEYMSILGRMPEMRTRFRNAAIQYKKISYQLPEELKILAVLYSKKFNILDSINGIMKNLRLDSGYKDAVLKAGLIEIMLYNRIIDDFFRKPVQFDMNIMKNLKDRIANVINRTAKYNITSKYLKIGDERGQQGDVLMVIDIIGNRAQVLLMAPTLNYNAVEGLVNLKELDKRTTWVKSNEFFFREKIEK